MVCSGNKSCEEELQEAKNTIIEQNKLLCLYKKKIETCNEAIVEKDRLRELVNEFEKWKKTNDSCRKQAFDELVKSFEMQCKHFKEAERNWQSKYCNLQKVNDCITSQLNTLKSNELTLQQKLESAGNNTKCLQKEICRIKSELEQTNCLVRKLKGNLESNEEDICVKQREIDECMKTCSTLNDTIRSITLSLKCTTEKLENLKLSATRAEEKFMLERDGMSKDIKLKCQRLNQLELRNNEAYIQINNYKSKFNTLMTTLVALKEASLKKYGEIRCVVHKLEEDNTKLEKELCQLKNKGKQSQRDYESMVTVVNKQKKIIHVQECRLKKFEVLSKKMEQMKLKWKCSQIPEKCNENIPHNQVNCTTDECCGLSDNHIKSTHQIYEPTNCVTNRNDVKMEKQSVLLKLDRLKNDVNQLIRNI